MHKGLTKEKIILAAKEILQRDGFDGFSLRILAEKLDVKAASLYKHFENMDELTVAVALKVYEEFDTAQREMVTQVKTRQEALLALAMAFREFAVKHPSFYRLLLTLNKLKEKQLNEVAAELYAPVVKVVGLYKLDDESKAHWTHIYMATVIGFMVGKGSGLSSCSQVNTSTSFRLAIRNIISALESLEREQIARASFLQEDSAK
ncbi:MAG: TetR/AcrR family transcriptional regulator [Phascolarctobacterium sp.]|nr:TetR/AcrR family transcriptional regulator [Phascolarctobacterium sp.]